MHAGGCQPGLNPKCQESNLIPLLQTLHVYGSAMALTTHGASFAVKITCHGPLVLPGEELGDSAILGGVPEKDEMGSKCANMKWVRKWHEDFSAIWVVTHLTFFLISF